MEQFTYSWTLASSWSVVPKVSWYWQMSQVVMSVLGEISFINKEKIKLLYEYLESLNIWKYFPGLSIMYDALNLYWFYFTISYCIIGCFACPRQNNRNHNFTIHQEFVVLTSQCYIWGRKISLNSYLQSILCKDKTRLFPKLSFQ